MVIARVWVLLLLISSSVHAQIQPEAKTYLDYAIDVLQGGFIRRERIDWSKLREQVYAAVPNAKVPMDTYPAIRLALQILGERHTSFLTPEENQVAQQGRGTSVGMRVLFPENIVATIFPSSPAAKAGILPGDLVVSINNAPPQPSPPANKFVNLNQDNLQIKLKRGERVYEVNLQREKVYVNLAPRGFRLGKVGYLELPNHSGDGQIEGLGLYGNIAQQAISEVDQTPTCGWVIDLRRNSGGNMWPMLVGAGPILGEGVVGSFMVGQQQQPWIYKNGASYIAEERISNLEGIIPYTLKNPMAPVAVLVSRITASSGEAVMISFIGRENTRFFGEPSNGVPTANFAVDFPDGALLIITASYMADRKGKAYNDAINPNQEITTDWANFANETDPVLSAAVKWLQTPASCN